MKKILILFAIILNLTFMTNAQIKEQIEQIQNDIYKGFVEDALKKIENLRSQNISCAVRLKLFSLEYKAYSAKYNEGTKVLNKLERQLEQFNDTCRPFAYLLYANLLINEYRYRYNLSVQEKTDLYLKITSLIQSAIKSLNKLLIPVPKDFKLIYPYFYSNFSATPTLADYLLRDALNIVNYLNTLKPTDYIYKFSITQEHFIDYKEFISSELQNPDKYITQDFLTLQIYQQGIKTFVEQKLDYQTVFWELKRLDWLYDLSPLSKQVKLNLVLKALDVLYQDFQTSTLADLVKAKIGVYLYFKQDYTKAHQIFTQILDKSENEQAIKLAKRYLNYITATKISISTPRKTYFIANEPIPIVITYRNLNKISVEIYKVPYKIWLNRYSESLLDSFFYQKFDITLPEFNDFKPHNVSYIFPALPAGYYWIIFRYEDKAKTKIRLALSSYVVSAEIVNKGIRVGVFSFKTGKPVANAKVTLLKKGQTKYTDNQGFAFFDVLWEYLDYKTKVKVEVDDQEIYMLLYEIIDQAGYSPDKSDFKVVNQIFLDRNIYRPGQKLYFKFIAYKSNGFNRYSVLSGKKVQVKLYDANYELVAEKELITNDFGSASGWFILPEGRLTGEWKIEAVCCKEETVEYFSVEYYKRPKFEILLQPTDKPYIAGDTVVIKGKAQYLNGLPVQNADIVAEVRYGYFPIFKLWWELYFDYYDHQLKQIIFAKTDDLGKFELKIATDSLIESDFFNYYNVSVKVSDLTGETHYASIRFKLYDKSLFLTLYGEDEAEVGKEMVWVPKMFNAFDKEIKQEVKFSVMLLEPPFEQPMHSFTSQHLDTSIYTREQWYKQLPYYEYIPGEAKPENWSVKKLVFSKQVMSGEQVKLNLEEAGIYKIVAEAVDPKTGKQVKSIKIVKVYSFDKQVVGTEDIYLLVPDRVKVGEKFKIVVGSYWKRAQVFLQVIYGDSIVFEKFIPLSKEQKVFEFEAKKNYLNSLQVNAVVVKNGFAKVVSERIEIYDVERKLDIETVTFRDRIVPNQKETWKFIVKRSNGEPTIAEVLASMYDASLDLIGRTNSWDFRLYKKTIPHSYIKLSTFANIYFRDPMVLYKTEYAAAAPEEDSEVIVFSDVVEPVRESSIQKKVEIRSDFSETPFFYPDIFVNKDGELIVEFTVPQSLTKWNFQILAHDKQIFNGYLQKYAYTYKPLMVYPNLPRFAYTNDKLIVSAKIVNNSTEQLAIEAQCEIQTIDFKQIDIVSNPLKTLTLAPNQTQTITWELQITDTLLDPIYITIWAKTDKFSDGERHLIPILSNKVPVIETINLYANPKEQKTYSLSELYTDNKQPFNLTIEYTAQPLWLSLFSLPYLQEYPYLCSEQLFNRIYANTTLKFIFQNYPQIRQYIIDQHSKFKNLIFKNKEFKSIALEATPWITIAKQEELQIQALYQATDINNLQYQIKNDLNLLYKRQNPDGGWGWFGELYSNFYITLYILEGINRLEQVNLLTFKKQAKVEAVKFIDNRIKQIYNYLKEEDLLQKNNLTELIAYSLYVRNLYQQIPISKSAQKAYNYFYDQMQQYWHELNLIGQAYISLAAYFTGKKRLANQILKSLKQRAIIDDELGAYWQENVSGWLWYQAPIETQVALINAFWTIKKDTNFVIQMKKWLLAHKRTNHWQSTKATADATYALAFLGQKWLDTNKNVYISINDEKYQLSTINYQIGYFKKSISEPQKIKQTTKITIDNQTKHPNFGAVYLTSLQTIEKINQYGNEVKISRQLFKKVMKEDEILLEPIDNQSEISLGDVVVVRLVIEVDRQMDFVHIKDLFPAGFEPVEQLSEYKYQHGLSYYQSLTDVAANFFITHLNQGKYLFEYELIATIPGDLTGGYTTLQCMYAPEFSAHSAGMRVKVKRK